MFVFIILGLFSALCITAGIALRYGKCLWLIAGYNTATAEEKAKYDKKKLGRAMSRLMFVTAGFIAAIGVMGGLCDAGILKESTMGIYAGVLVAVFIAVLTVVLIEVNTKCKK